MYERTETCHIESVKDFISSSLGNEVYDLGADTVCFAQGRCTLAKFL